MPEILYSIKSELARRGIRSKQIADAKGVGYDRLVRILNGYTYPDSKVLNKVREYLKEWDKSHALES